MIGLQFRNFSNVNFKGNLNQKNSNVQNQPAQMQEDKVCFTSSKKIRTLNETMRRVRRVIRENAGTKKFPRKEILRNFKEIDKY